VFKSPFENDASQVLNKRVELDAAHFQSWATDACRDVDQGCVLGHV
jgi:hypothetical protein